MSASNLQTGLHLVLRAALPTLAERGLRVPEPWIGVVDLARMVEGRLSEPPSGQPLGIVGLDALVQASGDGLHGTLAVIRRGVHDGKRYFDWKQIPLVFLVEGTLEVDPEAGGPVLRHGRERFPLYALFGRSIAPLSADDATWWWTPQLG